jgi:molybdopterin/thiamine biosynthesis adenylyltransferase
VNAAPPSAARGRSVAVIGLGNIGSQAVPLLAGISRLTRVLFVDPECYGASNLGNQRLAAKDAGQLKVRVQARALGALAPHIAIDIYPCRVEALPLGRLRHCIILACVDSRSARQSINRIAFRLGTPWIDAGLDRSGSVRARVYAPTIGDCLECNWGEGDYALLEQRVPCDTASSEAVATAAPMELGAIAAGFQVSLLRRLLSEEAGVEDELAHQQRFLDLPSGRGWIGRYAGKNPSCRFAHAPWALAPLARSAKEITLGDALALSGGEAADTTLSVDGQMIVHRLRCQQCRTVKTVGGRLFGRLKSAACRRCGTAMIPAALDVTDSLSRKDSLERSLAAFGIADGDIITLHTDDISVHYLVGSADTEEL